MFAPSSTHVPPAVVSLPSKRSANSRGWRPGRAGVGKKPAKNAACAAYVNEPGVWRCSQRPTSFARFGVRPAASSSTATS